METRTTQFLFAMLVCLVASCFGQGYASFQSPSVVVNLTAAPTGGGSPWTPQSPTNTIVEWVKSDAIVGLNDGDYLTSWTATVGNPLTNSAATITFETNVQNGKPVARSLENYEWLGCSFASQSQPYTIAIVFAFTGSTLNNGTFLAGATTSTRLAVRTTAFGAFANGSDYVSIGTSDTSWHILLIQFDGASTKYRWDGAGSDTTISATPGAGTLDGLTLFNYEGRSAGFGTPMDIGEVIVWSGILPDSDKTSFFSYANTRWAVY